MLASCTLIPREKSEPYNLAAALVRGGEFAEAETHFRAVIATEPSTQAFTGLGVSLWQLDRGDEAVASLSKAIEMDPGNAAACDQLGSIQVQQGNLEQAASTYRLLTRSQPSAAAHLELAQVLTRLGRTAEANRELELAKSLEPKL